MSEEFDSLFADEESGKAEQVADTCQVWKVLIIDDEQGVHTITRLALEGFKFENRGLKFLAAATEDEARKILKEEGDIALALIDVVLDREDSGLRLIKFIRDELRNKQMRLVIRTGQPGQAPEKDIIVNYDINDYKEKTELTSSKLFTTVMNALRSYRDLLILENSRNGLRKILDSSINILKKKNIELIIMEAEKKLEELLSGSVDLFQVEARCCFLDLNNFQEGGEVRPVDPYKNFKLDENKGRILENLFRMRTKISTETCYCSPFFGQKNFFCLFIESESELPDSVLDMIEFYCSGVMASILNVELHNEISEVNSELEDKVAFQTRELLAKNTELTSLIEQKKNLVRVLYHDLNNALTVILGAARLSIKSPEIAALRNSELWEKVYRSANLQKEIMEQIRDIDSVRSGKKQIELVPTSIRSVVDKGLFLFRDKLEQKGINFVVELSDPDLCISVEPVSFSNNVFNNLLSNAIKFSYDNSTIGVKSTGPEDGIVCLSISDEGIGIPPDLLSNIFREDKKTSRKGTKGEEGTGFGMPLVKTYMEYYEAKIEVESVCEVDNPQKHGTTFLLYLKVADPGDAGG